MSQPVNLWMSLRYGDLEVSFSTDDLSHYAPDVAADMTGHLVRSFTEAISELRGHGIVGRPEDDYDDEEDGEDTDDDEDADGDSGEDQADDE